MTNTVNNPAEVLQEGLNQMAQKSQQIDSINNDVNELKEVAKSMNEAIKANADAMATAIKSLSDFTIEQAKQNEQTAQKMLQKRNRADVYNNLNADNNNISESIMMKSDVHSEIVQWMQKSSTSREEVAMHDELATAFGSHIVNKWQSIFKSNAYSNDVNPMGGYTQMPDRKPLIDITNRNEVGDIVNMFGVRSANSNAIVIPKYEYDFKTESSKIKERGENEEFTFYDVSTILSTQTLTLKRVDVGYEATRDFATSNADIVTMLTAELQRNINFKIAETILSKTKNGFLKNQFPVVVRELEEKPANVIDTKTVATTTFRDLADQIASADNFRRRNFTNSFLLLSSRVINKMLFEYNNFGYPNVPFIDTKAQTINLGYIGTVPYVPIEEKDLLKFDVAATPKEIGAILIDAEAFHIYAKPDATSFTTQHPHITNVKNRQQYLLSMLMGCDLVNPYKVVILTVKNA